MLAQRKYEEEYEEWELNILPVDDWAREEDVQLEKDQVMLEKTLGSLDNGKLSDTRFAGKNRDLASLISGIELMREELTKFNIYNLVDPRNLEKYQIVTGELVDIIEGVKQHYVDFVNRLIELEDGNYRQLEDKKATIEEEQRKFDEDKIKYQGVNRVLKSDKQNPKLVRAESLLYAQLAQRKRRIDSLQKSYEADKSINRVMNIACSNGRLAFEDLDNLQRTIRENLAMYTSTLSMGTMLNAMEGIDYSKMLDSSWNAVEYFQRTVERLQRGADTDPMHESIAAMNEKAEAIEKGYRARFGNGGLTK